MYPYIPSKMEYNTQATLLQESVNMLINNDKVLKYSRRSLVGSVLFY